VTELGSDYFHFDAAKHELLGERTGQRFRLGDRLKVKVARVDLETIKIDFVMAEPSVKGPLSGRPHTPRETAGGKQRASKGAREKEGGRGQAPKVEESGKKPRRKRKPAH
jgi:ribonuclease R